jgi:peptidyl-prolyl cis-trans isomerase D
MAIIGKIRQRSWILVGFIAIALIIFIAEAALERNSLFGGGGDKNSVGQIGGSSVSAQEFSTKVTNYEEALKMLNPGIQLNDQTQSQIQEEVWNSIASERLLSDSYKSLGLNISEAEMGELMWGAQPHPLAQRFLMKIREVSPDIINQQTGQLNQGKIREFITNIDKIDKQNNTNFREMLGRIEELIKDDQIKQKYASLVAQSFYMPTFMAKEIVNAGRSAKIDFVSVPYSSLPDDKYKVSDDEINQYLKANKTKFEQTAARIVDIVSFDILPSAEDTVQAIQKINKLREEFVAAAPKDSAFIARNSQQGTNTEYLSKEDLLRNQRSNADNILSLPVGTLTNVYEEGSYYVFTKIMDRRTAPDSVRAAHILLSEGKKTDDEIKAANVLADSLIKVIQSNTKTFGQVAAESSLDKGSAEKGGDLGYFTRGQMVKEFNDKVFYSNMTPGQIVKVQTNYGLHIILLIDAKHPQAVTKFADFVVELAPSSETEKIAYDKAADFLQKNQTPAEFDKAAKSENLVKNIQLTQNMVDVPQVGSARKLVQWAFQQDKPGVISDFDNETKYMIAKLNKVIPKGLPKAEDVREEISALVRDEKKGKDLVKELNAAAAGTTDLRAIAAKVKDATVTDTATVRFSSTFVPNAGNEPVLVGTAFGLPAGKTSKAVAGEKIAFIVQPKSVEENAPDVAQDINGLKQQMQSMYISRLNFQGIFNSILKNANVTDTRYKFY